MPEKQKPGSGVQVSGVTAKEASDEEVRIQPIRAAQYPQCPMRGENSCYSRTPGSRPASMDLATEAWRPRGRWAGTRRPGPQQTLASGPMGGEAGPDSCLLGEYSERPKKMLSSSQQEKYHFLAHLSRNLNKFLCLASHPTNIAPFLLFKSHLNKEQSERQVTSSTKPLARASHILFL